jgi:endoglucanase
MPIPKHTHRYLFLITLSLGGLVLAMTPTSGSLAGTQPYCAGSRATAVAQESPLPAEAMTRMTAYFEARRSSRYMEQNCVTATYPGWETLPLKECTYSVKGANDPVKKTAKVIMLNAEPDQLARWVVATCIEVVGSASNKCTKAIGRQIIGQSGAQFPVAGIVFEDILPEDGKFEVFAFRNGVTVRINGVNHLGTAQPSAVEIEKSLHGDVISTLKFARVQSTTREQYLANGGTRNVTGNAWNEVNRDLYKAAWGHNRNEMMVAWGRANKASLQ